MKNLQHIGMLLILASFNACTSSQPKAQSVEPLPSCEWCGAMDAPENPGFSIQIAASDEPGERMHISGTVYQADGKTPAPGILLYVYHTNNQGIYSKRGDETGNGRRHGYLRGWMRTNERGQYAFKSIKPAPYPDNQEPAHVHITVSGPGLKEYWIDSYWFEGDPFITEKQLAKLEGKGGFLSIVSLEKDGKGVWVGERNIMLE